jgi:hypothetical protein
LTARTASRIAGDGIIGFVPKGVVIGSGVRDQWNMRILHLCVSSISMVWLATMLV